MKENSMLDFAKSLQQKTQQDRETVEQLTSKELKSLAKNLSEQSKQGLNTISKDISQSLQNHKTHLKSTIAENENDITQAIASHKAEIVQQTKTTYSQVLQALKRIEEESTRSATTTRRSLRISAWLWPLITFLICLMILGIAWGTTLFLGKQITAQASQLLEVNRSLSQAESRLQTLNIEITENEKGRFLILPLRTKAEPGWMFGEREGVKLSRK